VTYGPGRQFSLWARVNLTAPLKRIVAAADLKPGQPIEAASVEESLVWSAIPAGQIPFVASIDEIAGFIPRRSIASGTAIRKEWLEPPRLVQKGDIVKVEIVNGGARLELTARAEGSGARGELIPVENLDSKRRFRARVEAKGKVSVKTTP
jgi:flagella basal body P-ring formation protein FlgA